MLDYIAKPWFISPFGEVYGDEGTLSKFTWKKVVQVALECLKQVEKCEIWAMQKMLDNSHLQLNRQKTIISLPLNKKIDDNGSKKNP
jgi:hypothetical protein